MNTFLQLKKDIREIEVSTKKIKQFGYLVGSLFVLLGLLLQIRHSILWSAPIILGAILILLALVRLDWLTWPYRIWMTFGTVTGFFVSRILLIVIYFCVILPIGLVYRVFNRDPLNLAWDQKKESYWIKKHYRDHDTKQPF